MVRPKTWSLIYISFEKSYPPIDVYLYLHCNKFRFEFSASPALFFTTHIHVYFSLITDFCTGNKIARDQKELNPAVSFVDQKLLLVYYCNRRYKSSFLHMFFHSEIRSLRFWIGQKLEIVIIFANNILKHSLLKSVGHSSFWRVGLTQHSVHIRLTLLSLRRRHRQLERGMSCFRECLHMLGLLLFAGGARWFGLAIRTTLSLPPNSLFHLCLC